MQFARINDVTLHHQLIGAPEGRPVLVFINSLGTDFRIWRDVIVQFAGDAAIVAYDKRGHGLSDTGTTPYAMEDHVADLAGLLDHLNVRNAVICGVSVGAMIAQGLALSRPDLVRALVLCGAVSKAGEAAVWNGRIDTVNEQGIAGLADATMERWFTAAFRSPDNAAFSGYLNMLLRSPVEGYTATCAALRDADLTESTRALKVPTLCIVGDQDGSTPPDLVRSTADLIDGARFEIVEGAGHLPCIEQPEKTARLIGDFLSRSVAA